MKIKPKDNTPEDFLGWVSNLVDFGKETRAIRKTPIKTVFHFPKKTAESTSTYKQPVHIAMFSGETSDSSYEICRYEVMCLTKEGYAKETILNAIRMSLN